MIHNMLISKNYKMEFLYVTKAITGKTTMPILEGIYIQATKEGLTLIGSDMDVSIETKVEAEVLTEGSIVIDSKIFSEIIRKLPNSDVKIEIAENDLVQITCEKSVFQCCLYECRLIIQRYLSINEDLNVRSTTKLIKKYDKRNFFCNSSR